MAEANASPTTGRRIPVRQIGLLAADDNALSLYRMPVYPRLLEGLQTAMASAELSLTLLEWGPGGSLPGLDPDRLGGVFVIGRLDAQTTEHLARSGLPVVWLMRAHSDERGRFDHVFYDNDRVGRLAAHWVLRRGHASAAFINARPSHGAFPDRGRRFAETLAAAGKHAELLIAASDGQPVQPLVDRFARLAPRPGAIFVPNDAQAPALYTALAAHRLQVGRDLDVIACDNERSILDTLYPPPATIDLNLETVGRRGVEQMLHRILTADRSAPEEILIAPTLVEAGA